MSATRDLPELYFKTAEDWRNWLKDNHDSTKGVYLIFYKVNHERESMRWEEAVKGALCFGWIDSTVKSLGDGKRKQYFCPRKPKSAWSAKNKSYIEELESAGLMHESGRNAISVAKENGSWYELDDVERGVIPEDLMEAFKEEKKAYENFRNFSLSSRKSYLRWLQQAKRPATRMNRIKEIVRLCRANLKFPG